MSRRIRVKKNLKLSSLPSSPEIQPRMQRVLSLSEQPELAQPKGLSFDVIDKLCLYIEMYGVKEGVFRIPGDTEESQICYNSLLDSQDYTYDFTYCKDPNSAASALKLYLRRQPVSILGTSGLGALLKSQIEEAIDARATVTEILAQIPKTNKMVLRRLLMLLSYVLEQQAITKMAANNIG
jgi:putative ribosome biogenesis GTPase RsgA